MLGIMCILFLANTTSLIQPVDQEVIEKRTFLRNCFLLMLKQQILRRHGWPTSVSAEFSLALSKIINPCCGEAFWLFHLQEEIHC